MRIYLAGVEARYNMIKPIPKWHHVLVSFLLLRPKQFEDIIQRSDSVMVDSGAHSFQKGVKVDWDGYTEKYIELIKGFDCKKIVGFFEMDVDNVIGVDKVVELRKRLNKQTDKIIEVWHRQRGIEEYGKMCDRNKGGLVAVSGFANEDITFPQYGVFLKIAWQKGCRLHILGNASKRLLDSLPVDSVDSSSWTQEVGYGHIRVNGKPLHIKTTDKDTGRKGSIAELNRRNFIIWTNRSKYYELKWALLTKKLKKELACAGDDCRI